MLTLKMASRNVLRQKRRTLLTVLTITGGFVLAAVSIGWSDGSYNVIIDMFTRNELGHIQVHAAGYLDRPSLYKNIDHYEAVGETIGRLKEVTAWAPRIYSAGLAAVGEKTMAAQIHGIDPDRESEATRFDRKIADGRLLSSSGAKEAILGQGLAEVLHAAVGDTVIVLSQAADGSIANDAYPVVGLMKSGDSAADQSTLYLGLEAAERLFVLPGKVHEIAVVVGELDQVTPTVRAIEAALHRPDLSVAPWQEFAKSFYTAMRADQQGMWIMLGVILLIVAVGVLNTVLMSVLERTREYGILRAIGVHPWQVGRLVIYEVTVIALAAIVIGCPIALAANYWLSQEGVGLPSSITYGGVEFSHMYSEVNVRSFVIPAITVFLAALAVSVFPAIKAARIAPAKAMRVH